jgi:NADH:ubiquinone oxidoreductase subunit K
MTLYPVGIHHFLTLGTVLFCIGMYGALARRNAIGVLLSIELMFNGVNVLMVTFARYVNPAPGFDLAGQLFAIFIVTVAAAEAAVGLAIVIAVYRLRRTVAVDEMDLLKG